MFLSNTSITPYKCQKVPSRVLLHLRRNPQLPVHERDRKGKRMIRLLQPRDQIKPMRRSGVDLNLGSTTRAPPLRRHQDRIIEQDIIGAAEEQRGREKPGGRAARHGAQILVEGRHEGVAPLLDAPPRDVHLDELLDRLPVDDTR